MEFYILTILNKLNVTVERSVILYWTLHATDLFLGRPNYVICCVSYQALIVLQNALYFLFLAIVVLIAAWLGELTTFGRDHGCFTQFSVIHA